MLGGRLTWCEASLSLIACQAREVSRQLSDVMQAVLLGFNTSQNVYALLSLSAPIYNYTTNTVFFNYLLKTPTVAANTNATNGWLINFFTNSPESVSGAVAMLAVPAGGVTLFTPSLLTTIPCVSTQAVPKGSCTIYNAPDSTCSTGGHGQWINGTFCG